VSGTCRRTNKEDDHAGYAQGPFFEEVKDIYDAEHRITKALPKMAKAPIQKLVSAFEEHLSETEVRIRRLRVFD
jgi:ferritin-like metal-binding protein YciE